MAAGFEHTSGAPNGTGGGRSPANQMLCPVCLDYIEWREDKLFEWDRPEGKYLLVDLSNINNATRWVEKRSNCYIRCPNPAADTAEHYLPVSLRDGGTPIVIGLVGEGLSGKTHLLTAMIMLALRGDLGPLGLTFTPADRVRHVEFKGNMDRFRAGWALNATSHGRIDPAELLIVDGPTGRRPLVFFDVAGEDFTRDDRGGRYGRFLLGVTALIFVEDPALTIPGLRPNPTPEHRQARANDAFNAAMNRLRARPELRSVPAALVLTKSDRLRYEYPIDGWLRRADDTVLDAEDFRAETRDVYAFLAQHDARAAMDLFRRFDRFTMHFVSATGVDEDTGRFPRGVRPTRVLRPLAALLAMTGVLDGAEARKVGI